MNRQYFMDELARRLVDLPQAERDAALLFYNELFDEAGPESEQQVIEELGSPYHVAAKILAEFAAEQTLGQNGNTGNYSQYQGGSYQSPKKRISWLWYLLIGVCAAPVALPVAFTAIAAVIALVSCLFAVVVTVGALFIAFAVVAVALFFGGVYYLVVFPAGGLVMLGISLVMAAVALFMFLPIRWLLSHIFDLVTRGVASIFNRISGGAKA